MFDTEILKKVKYNQYVTGAGKHNTFKESDWLSDYGLDTQSVPFARIAGYCVSQLLSVEGI